jgi:hypothetical protein
MEYILYILIVLGSWFAIPTIYKIFRDEKAKKEKHKKLKLDTNISGFTSIDLFNSNEYIKDTFEQLFHAINVDAWPCDFSFNEIIFKKGKVELTIEYSDYGNFKIRNISVLTGYNRYYFKSDLDSEVYQFFYEIYSKAMMKQNDDLKKVTDDSLVEITKVLGRDTIRDSKIDMLLNGKE